MATPQELLQTGRLGPAVQELTQLVKARPADLSLRVFLFELLCFEGALDRAGKQLDVIAAQSGGVGSELAVQVYRALLTAERVRAQVFEGDALPKFLFSPPAYCDHYVLMVKQLPRTPKDAVARLPEAEEQCPALSGRRDGRSFSRFRDADDRVAPILEVFHGADYVWLPLEQIRRIEVSEPKSIRDLLWARVHVETFEQSVGDVFVPALYVGSHTQQDDQVRLGRMTTWTAVEDQLVYGAGQRVFLVDDEEASLFELKNVEFDRAEEKGAGS
jgi:type VI secretion system protein ImpE